MKETATSGKRVIPVSLEERQIARLEALAEKEERTKSFLVRKAVEAYFAQLDGLQKELAAR